MRRNSNGPPLHRGPRKVKGRTSHPTAPSDEECLCLICRQVGHVAKSCPRFRDKTFPMNTQTPDAAPCFNLPSTAIDRFTETLCHRCNQLDVVFNILAGTHPSGRGDNHLEIVRRKRRTPIPPLGHIKSLRLLSTCPLCRLIFDITYLSEKDLLRIRDPENDHEGQLALVPVWTIVHLEPDMPWPRDGGLYAKCVYTIVTRAGYDSGYQPEISVRSGVDAIGVVDAGLHGSPALGVRIVDPQSPDYSMIKGWLRHCDELHHITCRPLVSEDLKKIKLIDVETRQIVMYPPDGCDYIALSYVWGRVDQPSYKLGDTLQTVPATLEDAMVVVRNLGKRYFWADSLCIDQGNSGEKAVQIALMSDIYTGAWATIFNVAGRSAHSQLPRVGTVDNIISQLSCEIGGKRLLSIMPSLSEQISRSFWATRAWTFQEGMLSPRRLFFTNHQVYFECNSAQCCESLDDTNSPFHHLSDEQRGEMSRNAHRSRRIVDRGPDEAFSVSRLRDPFRPILVSEKPGTNRRFRISKYEELVYNYTRKNMTKDIDSLNAFSAFLKRFEETHYKRGFLHGLPVEDLPTALLWTHDAPSRRRVGFPTWSWAGWQGAVKGATSVHLPGVSDGFEKYWKYNMTPPLRVWKARDDDRPGLVYDFSPILEDVNTLGDESNESDGEGADSLYSLDDDEGSITPDQRVSDDEEDLPAEDAGSWEDVQDSNSVDSEDSVDAENDPIFLLAKTMLEESPVVPENIGRDELLIQGIVFRMTFMKFGTEYNFPDPDDLVTSYQCSILVEDKWSDNHLVFHGHNSAELVDKWQGKEREFLLLGRTDSDCALMLIDWDGDTAEKAGVASLRYHSVKMLAGITTPEVKLFKLK